MVHERKIKLNFHGNSAGTHDQAWREPYGAREGEFGVRYYQELAQIAESGLFDAIFFADSVGYGGVGAQRASSFQDPPRIGGHGGPTFDPLVILTAIAAVTERIGLVGSASTTFSEPYNIARQYSTLDHVSRGRAGWNVITTMNENAARNFGLTQLPEKAERYSRAEEFVDVVKKLWDSWDYESLARPEGVKNGRPLRSPARIDHSGRYYRVGGPFQLPNTPQRSPVIFQAGGSPDGLALAARTAEGVFSQAHTVKQGQEFYQDLKARAAAFGRRPEDVLILPGIYVYLGSTEAEVEEIRRELYGDLTLEKQLETLANALHVEASELHLDEPIPETILQHALEVSRRSTIKSLVATASEGRPTVREICARRPRPMGHRDLVDVPERIAASLEEWFLARAADGFNVGNMTPRRLREFVDNVIPILQRRGLYRTEYRGETLRSHYREDIEDEEARSAKARAHSLHA